MSNPQPVGTAPSTLNRRKFLAAAGAGVAGGLLLAIAEETADDLLTELRRNYPRAEIVGRAIERGAKSIIVK